jgi:hypothetical protein
MSKKPKREAADGFTDDEMLVIARAIQSLAGVMKVHEARWGHLESHGILAEGLMHLLTETYAGEVLGSDILAYFKTRLAEENEAIAKLGPFVVCWPSPQSK